MHCAAVKRIINIKFRLVQVRAPKIYLAGVEFWHAGRNTIRNGSSSAAQLYSRLRPRTVVPRAHFSESVAGKI